MAGPFLLALLDERPEKAPHITPVYKQFGVELHAKPQGCGV